MKIHFNYTNQCTHIKFHIKTLKIAPSIIWTYYTKIWVPWCRAKMESTGKIHIIFFIMGLFSVFKYLMGVLTGERRKLYGRHIILFGKLGLFFRWSHLHGFAWVPDLIIIMLALEMFVAKVVFWKRTLAISGVTVVAAIYHSWSPVFTVLT